MTMTQTLTAKVDHALHAVESFSQLLELETAALKASDFPQFEALQHDKIARAQDYQESILAFESDLDVLQSLDEELKHKLRTAHSRFTVAADDNHNTLLATRNASERIVTMIMDAARKSVSEGPAYNAGGVQDLSGKIPIHFKLNEVL